MKRYLKLIYFFVVLFIILGVSYAWFNYQKVSETEATLINGEIYLRLNEDTNAINVSNAFPESSVSARSKSNNTLEFTVYGKNESSDDIYYEIFLNHGNDITDKVRIDDDGLAFDLVRINNDNTETMLLDAVSYENLTNKKIWVDYIEANTNTEVSKKYKLRMWIANKVTFGEGNDAKYTNEEFKNLFASIKIGVDGKLKEKSFPLQYQYDDVENSFLLTTRNDYVERDVNKEKEDVVKVLISDPKNHVKMSCVDTEGTTHTDEESLNLVYVFEKNKEVNSVVKIDDIDKYGSDVKFEVYKNEVKVHEFTRTVYQEKTRYKEIGTVTYNGITGSQTLYEGKKNLVNKIVENENFIGWSTVENGNLEYRLGDEIDLTGEVILYPVYA